MCVNGLQIPSHSHVTVLQQVSECTEKPHRASSQEAAEKKVVYPSFSLTLWYLNYNINLVK